MQNQRDKIPRKNNMHTSWPRSTTKPKKEGQWSQIEVLFVRLLLSKNISTLKPEVRVSFSATDCRKLLAIMTIMRYRRRHCLSANVPLERKWKTPQKNETGQLSRPITLYRHLNTAHYGIQWPQKLKQYPKLQPNRPKREVFEALMPVASSSSPTHDIYGNTVIIISVVVSFKRSNNCEHTHCSLWF